MAWISYSYTSSYPKFYYDINYNATRNGANVTIDFTIQATINGWANILGPVVLEVGYYNGSTNSSVVIKNRSGDYWESSTRTKTCSLTFQDFGTSKDFYVRVTSGDLTNANMTQRVGTCTFAGITPPTAPTYISFTSNPVEVNTTYTLTWGAGTQGTLPIANWQIEQRAWNGSTWTNWVTYRTLTTRSLLEPAPKNKTVSGITGSPRC